MYGLGLREGGTSLQEDEPARDRIANRRTLDT